MRSLAVVLLACATAHANPASIVPTAGDGTIHVDYQYELDQSAIRRERAGDSSADPNGGQVVHDDLKFQQFRHTLTPRADIGIAPDTWFSVALPIIITQARELRLASGVSRSQSSTLQDGFLPQTGFDAGNPDNPPSGDLVFAGASRSGVPEVVLGLGIAPMNQHRDDTKPVWKLGVDFHLAIGKAMRFDRLDPSSQTGVSDGVHKLSVWTTMDRKVGWYEPWFKLEYTLPFATRDASLFQDPGFGSTNVMLGQTAGASFGLEVYAVDDPKEKNALSVEVGGRVKAHFEGRGYSEMWEVFAYAGDARVQGNPLILDKDPTADGIQAMSHPGITNIENYMEVGGTVAIRAQLGPRVHLAATVDIVKLTDHAISFADSGIDLPTCKNGATTGCEADSNIVVNPGTREVNPVHAPAIDRVGSRYLSEQNLGLILGVSGELVW